MAMGEMGGAATADPFGSFGSGAFGGAFGGTTSAGDSGETGDVRNTQKFGGNSFSVTTGGGGWSAMVAPALVAVVALGAIYFMNK